MLLPSFYEPCPSSQRGWPMKPWDSARALQVCGETLTNLFLGGLNISKFERGETQGHRYVMYEKCLIQWFFLFPLSLKLPCFLICSLFFFVIILFFIICLFLHSPIYSMTRCLVNLVCWKMPQWHDPAELNTPCLRLAFFPALPPPSPDSFSQSH